MFTRKIMDAGIFLFISLVIFAVFYIIFVNFGNEIARLVLPHNITSLSYTEGMIEEAKRDFARVCVMTWLISVIATLTWLVVAATSRVEHPFDVYSKRSVYWALSVVGLVLVLMADGYLLYASRSQITDPFKIAFLICGGLFHWILYSVVGAALFTCRPFRPVVPLATVFRRT